MNEGRMGFDYKLKIGSQLWSRYSVTVHQILMPIVNFPNYDFDFTTMNPWFCNFLVSSKLPAII